MPARQRSWLFRMPGRIGRRRACTTTPADNAPPEMKIRTLIVDDEAPARARLRQLLRLESDFDVIGECGNGRQAVAALQKQRPDLGFLHVQMPRLRGFQVFAGGARDLLL